MAPVLAPQKGTKSMPKLRFEDLQQYRDIWEANGNRLMREDEVADFDDFFADPQEANQYQSEGVTRALAGDFSQYETVEPMMKGYFGAKKCYDLYHRFQGNASDPELQQEIKNRLMEVDLRTGFALGGKNPDDSVGKFFKECERIANRQMLIQTLEEPEPTAKLRLRNQLEREDSTTAQQKMDTMLSQDLEQRVEIAKILFLSHLGKFQTYANDQAVEMNENIAEAYTHGGRTMFILPAGGDQTKVMEGIKGAHPEQSGLSRRGFATHAIKPRTLHGDGTIASEATELSVKRLGAFAPRLHKGMNASVGGLGQLGPNGKVITSDGTNGHMYMHLVKGGEKVCGTMLVGFENAGPGQKGRLGHAHGASAKKAGSSAFLSDKSYLGNEFGGRVVDLSGLDSKQLTELLTAFEEGYRTAAQAAQTGTPALLDACNDLLTGKQMSVGQMKGLLAELNVSPEKIQSVEPARAGSPKAHNYKPISPEEHPVIPVNAADPTAKKPVRITECEGLVRPKPPKVMKKPSRLDKFFHQISFHSKRSYVSRYHAYQQELPQKMEEYKTDLANYYSTLEALENGRGTPQLQEAYNRAVQQAEAVYGPAVKKTVAAQPLNNVTEPDTRRASPQTAEALENAILDALFKNAAPEKNSNESPEDLRNEFRGHIQQTSSYQKLIKAGDSQISAVLNDPEKMQNVLKDVSNGILAIVEPGGKVPNVNIPQRNNEVVAKPVENAPRSISV